MTNSGGQMFTSKRYVCYDTLHRSWGREIVLCNDLGQFQYSIRCLAVRPREVFPARELRTCVSIIDIAIDLFTSEDRYCLWIAAVPLFTIPTTFGNVHAWCYTREAPLTQSATQVRSSLLDSSMLWLFRKAITTPIIVFTSSATSFAEGNRKR